MPTINIHVTALNHPRDGDLLSIDVAADLSLADLKAYVSAETDLDPSKQAFFFEGRTLTNDQTTIQQAGIKDGDMLAVLVATEEQAPARARQQPTQPQRGSSSGSQGQAELIRERCARDPALLSQLRQQAPDLANAVQNPARFRQLYQEMENATRERNAERERQMQLLNEDPMNVEAQMKIEEMIRQERVYENLTYAQEHNPESFASVTMLYINAKVNGHPIKVLVDSGAQVTIMSPATAEACNIMRLIDRRYEGVARGVGTAKILGKVHSADMTIGNSEMPCSFMVMEGKAVDLLLGLDMLKKYQVSIDLRKNKLVFPHEEVDFLPESEIPRSQEEERAAEPTVPGPDGTEIGTESGVVRPAGSSSQSSTGVGNFRGPGHALSQDLPQPNIHPTSSAPSASSSAASRQSTQPVQTSQHPKEAIEQLQGLGFTRGQAIAALDATDGNVDMAAGLLFG